MSNDTPRLENRLALITGASRGIGRATALELAREGAHVIATARTVGALEELDDEIQNIGGQATLIPLDLKDGEKIDNLGPSLYQRWGKIDIFIANGAMLGPLTPLPHVATTAWDDVIATNLTANWRLIRTLDPLLRRSDAGRVLFVSSGAATGKYAYWGPYAAAKAGVEAMAKTYANEIADSLMRVNIITPGGTATGMRAKAFPGEDPKTLPTAEQVALAYVAMVVPDYQENGQLVSAREWLAERKIIQPQDV
ncbi:MAG: SDR family NAD(P)-dependent oxidoreductase [Hyphomicrobiaceae bacterium]